MKVLGVTLDRRLTLDNHVSAAARSCNYHALQHHLSGTLSLSPFRTVTRLHYLNLDLKHICSPPLTGGSKMLLGKVAESKKKKKLALNERTRGPGLP